jgi:hypothetical protein
LHVGVSEPLQISEAVTRARAFAQVGSVGLLPKEIELAGHPVIIGGVTSTVQV